MADSLYVRNFLVPPYQSRKEHMMISRRRSIPRKILARHMEELDRTNREEEKKVIEEVANIKRNYIKKFGRPKVKTSIPIKGIASEDGHPGDE